MTSPAGEKMSSKRGTFCCQDCQYNPNGCSYWGRVGPVVGVREMGTVKTLSGKTLPAYRECISLNNRQQQQEWAIRQADGRMVYSATTRKSFEPNNS